MLAGLAADRRPLGALLVAEVARHAGGQEGANRYGPQVVMLHAAPGRSLRANRWPAAGAPLLRRDKPRRFFYGVAHDHYFPFLTVG